MFLLVYKESFQNSCQVGSILLCHFPFRRQKSLYNILLVKRRTQKKECCTQYIQARYGFWKPLEALQAPTAPTVHPQGKIVLQNGRSAYTSLKSLIRHFSRNNHPSSVKRLGRTKGDTGIWQGLCQQTRACHCRQTTDLIVCLLLTPWPLEFKKLIDSDFPVLESDLNSLDLPEVKP